MRALLGEKKVRLFSSETGIAQPIFVNYDEFFENYQKNTEIFILDKSCASYSLDLIKNTNIF